MTSCKFWLEKYRPTTLDDVVGQDDIIPILKKQIAQRTINNMIFCGNPSVGKTSVAEAFAQSIFNKQIYPDRVLEMNASAERGIKSVRDKIKKFAQAVVFDNSDIIPLKLVILDEADCLTKESQYALRRIIEDSIHNTRYILICNYHDKIISEIISRFDFIYFKNIAKDDIRQYVMNILKKENVEVNDFIHNIIDNNNNLRVIVNQIQMNVQSNKHLDYSVHHSSWIKELGNHNTKLSDINRYINEDIQNGILVTTILEDLTDYIYNEYFDHPKAFDMMFIMTNFVVNSSNNSNVIVQLCCCIDYIACILRTQDDVCDLLYDDTIIFG